MRKLKLREAVYALLKFHALLSVIAGMLTEVALSEPEFFSLKFALGFTVYKAL